MHSSRIPVRMRVGPPALALATVGLALLSSTRTCPMPVLAAKSTSVSSSASTAAASFDPLERERYVQFPQTVFAPTGRLHTVDKVCLDASNCDDVTAGLVVALRCGRKNGNECIVVVGTGSRSPLAIKADLIGLNDGNEDAHTLDKSDKKKSDDDNKDDDIKDNYKSPLLMESIRPSDSIQERPLVVPSSMSILSPGLVVATGGTPADAAVLLDRIRDVASDMHSSNFGGTGFMYQTRPNGGRLHGRIGMFGVDGADLARTVADMIHVPTQSIGTRMGSMLAASALILDAPQTKSGDECRIWRVDPSGQFWSCDAAAVGRGAGIAESFLLKEIGKLKGGRDEENGNGLGEDNSDVLTTLSSQDVKRCLDSLSVNEAIGIARKCVLKVYEKELERQKSLGEGAGDDKEVPPPFSPSGAILQAERNTVEILEL